MSAEVVDLSARRAPLNVGNGAREVMMELIAKPSAHCLGDWDSAACTDWLLATLWDHGFKIVPLETKDLAV